MMCLDIPTSCDFLKRRDPKTDSGMYVIDPDGPGGVAPFMVRLSSIAHFYLWLFVIAILSLYFTSVQVKQKDIKMAIKLKSYQNDPNL